MQNTTLFIIPCACSLGSTVALELLGKPYQIGITTPEIRASKEFRIINPLGKVSALINGRDLVSENSAILLYLIDQNPDSVIGLPLGSKERTETYIWLSYLSSTLHIAFAPLFRPAAYVDESAIDMFTRNSVRRLKDVLAYVNSYLTENDYFVGEKASLVDAQAYGILRWTVRFGVIHEFPAIAAFLQRMEEIPAVQNAMKIEEQKAETLTNSSFAGYYEFA